MYIDTHAHVNFNAYKDDADEVIKRSLKESVFMVNVGSQYSTSKRAVEMAHEYKEGVYAAVGLHPIQLKAQSIQYQDSWELEPQEIKMSGEVFEYEKYLELARDEKVVAIGEVGLDYHHFEPPRARLAESRLVDSPRFSVEAGERSPRVEAGEGDNISELKEKQKEVFLQTIKLANEVQKPIMTHCWDAYEDLYEILKNNPVEKKGVIHSFVGSYKTANKFIELGYAIGLNGVVTYGISYDRLIKEVALENIVLETDCPYLTPVPKKGERNEPVLVKLVAQKIAEIKGISVDEVAKITTENVKKLFKV